jgi:hypothetical protein
MTHPAFWRMVSLPCAIFFAAIVDIVAALVACIRRQRQQSLLSPRMFMSLPHFDAV